MTERASQADSQTPVWIGVATLVHATAIAALLLMPPRRLGPAAPPGLPPTEIAVTVEGEPAAPLAPPTPSEPQTPSEATRADTRERVATRGAAGASIGVAGAASSLPNGAGSPEPTLDTGEAPSTGGVVAIPVPSAQIGLGGIGASNPFLPRTEEKVATSGKDTPAQQALRGTGMARDRALGLGPEGPVIRALSDATSVSVAPLRGRAVFIVRSSGDGLVVGIDVVDAEGGTGWADAGKIALEALRGKKLAVPRGANGLAMRIEVSSDMKLPNGQTSPIELHPELNGGFTMPDVSNIGAKPRRVVHSRVVTTEVL